MNSNLVEQILSAVHVENPSDDYVRAIDIVSDVIINPNKYTEDEKIAVIPLETGCGKSSITNLSLAWLIKNDLPSAGTIILKERIEDCEDTVEQINRLCGREVAAPYHSGLFLTGVKYSFRYEMQYRRKLLKYPVLVMTHQGFIRRHRRLGDFLGWTDEKNIFDLSEANNPRNRNRLIVDEHPAMLKITRITKESLDIIESFAQDTSNSEMFEPIFQICAYIRSKCFVKPADLKNQYWDKCNVQITERLDEYFYDKRIADEFMNIYTALKIFCVNGGFVNFSSDSEFLNVTVGKHIDIFEENFNSIILDGTAKINSLYRHERFNIIDIPKIKTYSNTTINICKQLSGSRNELENHNDIIDAAIEYIRKTKPADEDGLTITLKSFEQDFIDKGVPPKVKVDHFGNITGTNKYMDIKYLYIIGVPYLTDNSYKIAYHTFSEDLDMKKDQGSVTVNGVRKLVDKDYNEVAASMIATELVQAINRVRCRQWKDGDTPDTSIFMLSRNEEIIDLIRECMDSVQTNYDFEFYERLSDSTQQKKHANAIDVVLSTISKRKILFSNDKVKKMDIFNSHELTQNLSDVTRAAIWKHPAIQQLEFDGKIKLYAHYIEFLQ